GVLKSGEMAVYRNPAGELISPSPVPVELYEQQKISLSHLKKYLNKGTFSTSLLFGVTGSGKTEVYYRAMEHVFNAGRQAILMVPEIALAIYMEGFFRSRLGDRVAIYHSGLSRGERHDQWMKIAGGDADLVIGARSALFAPLPRLGLIIVDEEHDSAYKQEANPRYQARDAAVVRAKMEKALVILGSGTPSVQSYQNSIRGKYHLLSMPERVEKRALPDVEIIDMKPPEGRRSGKGIFSPELRKAIDQNLAAGNQTLLFLNRRGFHRLYICRSCGRPVSCPNCDVALTYHLKEDRLVCHYCGFYSGTNMKCPSCGYARLRPYGFGTEKLEQDLRALFPDARVARMDTDTTRRKGQAFKILKKFSEHEIDILIGTQMITKGYDFQMVTLVGVIAADLSLGFPDFRAGERTFQILAQVAGRAGRGVLKGRVIVQTFNPEHYAINAAMGHNFQLFFEKERELRSQLGYPPFSHLAVLRLKGNSETRTSEAAHYLTRNIKGILNKWPKRGKELQVLGPVEAPIARIKGKFRWQILIKSKSVSLLQHLLNEVENRSRSFLKSSGVHLVLDIDPYQMT
ncbi:MAG: primosomal protein N', partial [Deltaproteobacteria bacterium]|nr:primosomal protein N' [Deltaproteobacteria bacterium]